MSAIADKTPFIPGFSPTFNIFFHYNLQAIPYGTLRERAILRKNSPSTNAENLDNYDETEIWCHWFSRHG